MSYREENGKVISMGNETPRYLTTIREACCWWVHDALIHPITGTFGLIGRIVGSYRVMALAHHVHNATAPSNDSLADYLEASYRAGCNETASNPTGSMTPDEQDWATEAYRNATGDKSYIQPQHAAERLKNMGKKVWDGQARRREAPSTTELEDVTPEDHSLFGRLSRAKFSRAQLRDLEYILEAAENREKLEKDRQ